MPVNFTIGKVAELSRVNIQTVRYYERRGILSPTGRRESGYRVYTAEALRQLRFIKNAQKLGFTLNEIGVLMRLRAGHGGRGAGVRRKTEAKLRQIDEKITAFRSMRRVLKGLINICLRRGTACACPILESLDAKKGRRK